MAPPLLCRALRGLKLPPGSGLFCSSHMKPFFIVHPYNYKPVKLLLSTSPVHRL